MIDFLIASLVGFFSLKNTLLTYPSLHIRTCAYLLYLTPPKQSSHVDVYVRNALTYEYKHIGTKMERIKPNSKTLHNGLRIDAPLLGSRISEYVHIYVSFNDELAYINFNQPNAIGNKHTKQALDIPIMAFVGCYFVYKSPKCQAYRAIEMTRRVNFSKLICVHTTNQSKLLLRIFLD